jgi:type IV pilus assembly protein PilC
MPLFYFVAKDTFGNVRSGTSESASMKDLVRQLRDRGWFAIQIESEELRPEDPSFFYRMNPLNWQYIRTIHIEMSLKQLALLLKSGLPLVNALEETANQASNTLLSRIWIRVSADIQRGIPLSEALEKHRCFQQLLVRLVRVGEETGRLELVLRRAALILEKRRNIRNHFIQISAYPLFVLCFAIAVTIFMVAVILPKIERFLLSINRELPPITKALILLSQWVAIYSIPIIFVLATLILSGFLFYRWTPGRYLVDRYALRIPILGKIIRLSGTIMLARSMATLIASGLTVVEGLRTLSQLHYNRFLSQQIDIARESLLQGASLSRTFERLQGYLPMLSSMISIGESSGNMEECLEEAAHFYEDLLELRIRWISTIAGPFLVLLIGLFIGFVYLAFFLSILGGVVFKG